MTAVTPMSATVERRRSRLLQNRPNARTQRPTPDVGRRESRRARARQRRCFCVFFFSEELVQLNWYYGLVEFVRCHVLGLFICYALLGYIFALFKISR